MTQMDLKRRKILVTVAALSTLAVFLAVLSVAKDHNKGGAVVMGTQTTNVSFYRNESQIGVITGGTRIEEREYDLDIRTFPLQNESTMTFITSLLKSRDIFNMDMRNNITAKTVMADLLMDMYTSVSEISQNHTLMTSSLRAINLTSGPSQCIKDIGRTIASAFEGKLWALLSK